MTITHPRLSLFRVVPFASFLLAAACSAPADESPGTSSAAATAQIPLNFHFAGPLINPNGACLDVLGGSTRAGATVDVWTCNGTPAQSFTFENDGTVHGPGGNCLDYQGGQLVMAACSSGSRTQKWNLREEHLVAAGGTCVVASGTPAPPAAAPLAVLGACNQPAATWTPVGVSTQIVGVSGHCLDVYWNLTADGSLVDGATCNGTTAQAWHFDSSRRIVGASGKCLEAIASPGSNGKADIRTCSDEPGQKWSFLGRRIQSDLGLCLGTQESSPAAWVDVEHCQDRQEQQWLAPSFYTEGIASLVVVTDDALAVPAQRLVDSKNATGMPAVLLTLDAINAQFPGSTDTQAKIKQALEYYYRYRGTNYVLLAGGPSHVPARFAYLYDQNHATPSTTISYRTSDFYYANLYFHGPPITDTASSAPEVIGAFNTWDTNGNGRYNESDSNAVVAGQDWNPDGVDGCPDLAVGRVPANTAAELDAYVSKEIAYETTTMSGPGHAAFIADELYAGNGQIYSEQEASEISAGFNAVDEKIVVNHSAPTPVPAGYVVGTQSDVVNALGTNGWMFYNGHGSQLSWDQMVSYQTVQQQMTQVNLPIVLAAACWSGTFVDTIDSGEKVALGTPPPAPVPYESFAGYWLSNVGSNAAVGTGGSIAYAAEGIEMDDGEATNLFVGVAGHYGAGERTLGDIWRGAQRDYWRNSYFALGVTGPRIYLGIMTLFGDPSLRVQRGSGPVQ